jgi:serine/threonine-protein kinase
VSHSSSTGDFLSVLERSGVLSGSGLQRICGHLVGEPGDATTLAERLVQEGSLTEFQAKRLLVGKSNGLVFGRYILLDRLGIGAMGRVFKARHRLMDRLVALKIVLPVCANSKHARSRFFREIKIVGLLDHPNVVRAFDADQHEDSPYIVMEYLEGEDLERNLRRRGILPPGDVIGYIAQAARGLAHSHEKGVVHRDVKPTNLFLTSAGVVKVLDLGLGAFVGVSSESVTPVDTDEGFVVGTTDYMSPEQLTSQPVDARTDLFSLGCTMYRLLTGAFAFPGATQMDRLTRRIDRPHVPISQVRKELPVPVIAVVDRLLAHAPEDRFASAEEVVEALESLLSMSERRGQGRSPGIAVNQAPRPPVASPPASEPPIDWTMVESALGPKRRRTQEPDSASTVRPRIPPSQPSSRRLNSYRSSLEEEGVESGRSVQAEYRKEVIQLNRTLADERTEAEADENQTVAARWLEKFGEQLGDFLAEPTAGHLILILLAVTFSVVVAFIYALS